MHGHTNIKYVNSCCDWRLLSLHLHIFTTTNTSSPSQSIPSVLWNRNVHYLDYTCHYSHPCQYSPRPQPHAVPWRFTLILLSHPRLGLPRGVFSSVFLTKPVCSSIVLRTCHMFRPSHMSFRPVYIKASDYFMIMVQGPGNELENQGIVVRLLVGARDSFFSKRFGTYPAFYSISIRRPLTSGKTAGAWRSPLISVYSRS